jgi:FMN reductase
VGNPKANSRTRAVAEQIGRRAATAAGLGDDAEQVVIEVAELSSGLFDWSAASVRERTEQVAASILAIVASPIYKASYTGLLKAFLDWFGPTGLAGVTAVPVMVGAAANHALAVEVHLRPVLIEIGATVPTRGVFVLENELHALDGAIDAWLEQAGPLLAASVAPRITR